MSIDMNCSAFKRYFDTLERIVHVQFPTLSLEEIHEIVKYSAEKRYREEYCTIDNNYTNKKIDLSLTDLTNYIMDREPIITAWGVLWKRKGTVENPLSNMIKKFMEARGILKKEMFKHPKGSEEFEKYNLLQL